MGDGLREKFTALQQAFSQDVHGRVAELEHAWKNTNLPEEQRMRQVQQLAHRMAGAAGTFGFNDLGRLCRKLEVHVQTAPLEQGFLAESTRTTLEGLIAQIRAVVDLPPCDTSSLLELKPDSPLSQPRLKIEPTFLEHPKVPELYLLLPKGETPDWVSQLVSFGYRTRVFTEFRPLLTALTRESPPVILIDDDVLPPGSAAMGLLEAFQTQRRSPIPVIMLSQHPELEVRIQAVRAGGRAYLPKPPDILSVVEAVESLSQHRPTNPYTVLVVEDDPLQSAHHAAVLENAGMRTVEVNHALEVMRPLVEARPDLVLMDVYMPEVSGVELAAAIRQQEAFVGIPIVFISREQVRTFQLEALRLGGDDFLTKPVDPEHLVSVVSTRAQRGRTLRSHMVRDSLTGLLNHTAILDQVELELSRADRSRSSMSVAMMDLDHFKTVNDTYGHAAGDRVLRSLARMLQQRLRKTDILGRYGGEEFAVILPSASAEQAEVILDDIRRSFSELEFNFGGHSVHANFSAGIADYPTYGETEVLLRAADEALYQAKRTGRNRVVRL